MQHPATFHDLRDASVFITGGGSGVGAALTDGFLTQGANVAFVGRSDANDFVDEMREKHGRAPLFLQGDITDTDLLHATMTKATQAHGPLNVLVNNAANDKRHTLEETTPEFWDWMVAINIKAYYFACQQAARLMHAKGGSIINFSSISYLMGNSSYPIYTTSNAGITGMSRSLARELGPQNIRVNALAPGWVLTQKQLDMWATPEDLAAHLDRQCLKEHLTPEDMIAPTLFLASEASRAMTGQCMVVDGGVVGTG